MIYLYALADPAPPPADLRGHGDAPVEILEHAGVAAALTRHDDLDLEPTEEALWRHEAVVEALAEHGAVLPVRFGAVLADENALRGELERRADTFRGDLELVRGRVELGLRVVWPEAPAAAPPVVAEAERPGRSYLLSRLAQERATAALADLVHRPLSELSVTSRTRVEAGARPMLAAAYLVERGAVAAFDERVERLQQEHPDLAVVCTGPWPPYSFVEEARRSDPA